MNWKRIVVNVMFTLMLMICLCAIGAALGRQESPGRLATLTGLIVVLLLVWSQADPWLRPRCPPAREPAGHGGSPASGKATFETRDAHRIPEGSDHR
jgi:hypothetical protein